MLGTVLAGAPPNAILGTLAVLVAAGAAVYWPALALAILAFTYPYDLTTYAGPVKVTSSAALMVLLVIVLVGRHFLSNPPPIRRTKLDIPVLLFAAASALSLASVTGNLSGQLVGLVKAFGGFTLFFIATQTVRELKDALVVVGAAIATGFVQAVQTVIPFVNGSQAVSVDSRASGNLVDPNLFAGYLVLVIPLALAIGFSFRHRWTIAPTAAVALVLVGALVATLSRSGWLGLVIGTFVLWITLVRRRWRIAAVSGVMTVAFVALGAWGPISTRLGSSDSGPLQMLSDRTEVWGAAIGMFRDHPLFGVGIDTFQDFYAAYSGRDDGLNHAHNLILNIAAERGILGLTSFCLVIFCLVKLLLSRLRTEASILERCLLAGLGAAVAAFLVHSQFDVSYYDYKVLLLLWLLIGVASFGSSTYSSLPSPLAVGWRSAPSHTSGGTDVDK